MKRYGFRVRGGPGYRSLVIVAVTIGALTVFLLPWAVVFLIENIEVVERS